MKCDNCDKEATVHEVLTTKGKVVEKHLCEQCARQAGMAGAMHVPITQLLSQYLTAQMKGAGAAPAGGVAAPPGVCGACGTSYAQFRHTGLLGCPECYRAFEHPLGSLLERAQEGAKAHSGKVPANAPAAGTPPAARGGRRAHAPSSAESAAGASAAKIAERQQRIKALKQQLAAAVAAEQYERAATIRDELARLERSAGEKGGTA